MKNNTINKVLIYGTGGVGGFIGGQLAWFARNHSPEDLQVFFVARGQHLAAIQQHGLILNTTENTGLDCIPAQATDNIQNLPTPDLVFVCVKSYDLERVGEALNRKISDKTMVIPLLNGIDVVERLRKHLKTGVVLPACIYVGTHIEKPGVVTQKGGEGKVLFGPDPSSPEFDPAPLLAFLSAAGVKHQWSADSYPAIWEKFAFIAAFGLVSAAFEQSIGEIMTNPESKNLDEGIAHEIRQIADKIGVRLPANIVETILNKAANFPFETKTSLQRDYEARSTGKPNEKDLFGGAIVRLGQQHRLATPHTFSVYSKLQ